MQQYLRLDGLLITAFPTEAATTNKVSEPPSKKEKQPSELLEAARTLDFRRRMLLSFPIAYSSAFSCFIVYTCFIKTESNDGHHKSKTESI